MCTGLRSGPTRARGRGLVHAFTQLGCLAPRPTRTERKLRPQRESDLPKVTKQDAGKGVSSQASILALSSPAVRLQACLALREGRRILQSIRSGREYAWAGSSAKMLCIWSRETPFWFCDLSEDVLSIRCWKMEMWRANAV